MGEARKDALRVGFDSTIKLEFHGARVSSDARLFPFRDLDEAVQLTESSAAELIENLMNTDSQTFGDLKPVAPRRPKMAFIGVTDRCNTRCRHCPHYHHTFGVDMSEAVTRKAIEALVDGAEVIVAQGHGGR